MSKSTGTPKSIATWLRNLRVDSECTFELAARSMEGFQAVASWTGAEVAAEPEQWAERVDGLTTADAAGRGLTTAYELRQIRGERVQHTTHLRRVIALEKDPAGDGFDGSSQAVIRQMAQSMERAHSQVIEAARAAIEAQRASMVLLGQAYQLIGGLQATNVELHAQQLEATPAHSRKDDTTKALIETFGPIVMQKLLTELNNNGGGPTGPAS